VTEVRSSGQFSTVISGEKLDASAVPRGPDFHELFATYAPYVWNVLRRLGAAPSDLEDWTHDVFVQVHGHLHEYDPSRPIRPWLFGFAFRVASQHRRRAYRRHETSGASHEGVDAAALPDARVAAEEDKQLVLAALQSVDFDRRAVFALYEIDEVPMEEIARTLGIPLNTAYSRLRVARTEFAAAVKRLRRGER
jgi:RNA polymerase sigma-70 factor (ECF subfamily)